MQKLWLIVQREYLTRIRKRSFLLGTILAPLGFLVYLLVIAGLAQYQGSDQITVAVLDKSGAVKRLADEPAVRFAFSGDNDIEKLKGKVTDGTYDGVVLIPEIKNLNDKSLTIFYYSDDKLTPEHEQKITERIEKSLREYKITTLGVDPQALSALDTDVRIDPETILSSDDGGNSKYSTGVAIGIGFIAN